MLAELQGCLSLCCPAGMGEDERADWLSVAMSELLTPPSVPNSYFRQACAHARRVCDHPSKIVPAIFAFNPGHLINRSSMHKELREIEMEIENMGRARLEAAKEGAFCTPEEAKDILAKFGMPSAFSDLPKNRRLHIPTQDELAAVASVFKREQGYSDETEGDQP